MSEPQHPNGPLPPGGPQTLRFSSPDALRIWLAADLAQHMLNGIASQLAVTQQPQAATWFGAKAAEMGAWKEQYLRADQAGIVLAGPGDVPPRT